jgi:hypothetical protein
VVKKESRTKPKQHRMENYDILTNGFFSSLPFPLRKATIFAVFQFFFRLLFVPFEETHIAPWRFLLASLALFCFHHLKNSNGFFQLPKKKH